MTLSLLSTATPSSRLTTKRLLGQGSLLLGLCLFAVACGGGEEPAKSPTKEAVSYQMGAPRNTHYTAQIEAERGKLRIIIKESSVCDIIPIKTIEEDGKKHRVAGEPTSAKECSERFARNVVVSLGVSGNTFRLGEPDESGTIETELTSKLMRQLYGDDVKETPNASVMVRDQQGNSTQVGTVALVQLAQVEQRLETLLAEFRTVLDRNQAQLSGAELAKAYELYEQLAAFQSDDPRIGALQAVFLERLYQRKATEANERFKNNIQALNGAKEILSANKTTLVVPGYVSAALQSGQMDRQTVQWAQGQVALSIRNIPSLCGDSNPKDFSWSRANIGTPKATQIAFEVLRFAYDNPYEQEITKLCRRVVG